jgi:hypothetical protein
MRCNWIPNLSHGFRKAACILAIALVNEAVHAGETHNTHTRRSERTTDEICERSSLRYRRCPASGHNHFDYVFTEYIL